MKSLVNLDLVHEIQQFYYSEARMLDAQDYLNWLKLLSPTIQYTMPNRNNLASDCDDSINIEPPLREDSFLTLTLRANRPNNPASCSDNPPMRTRRSVSNIEIFEEAESRFNVFNNVLMNYSRHGDDNHLYSFQRKDALIKEGDSFKIESRHIIIDWNIVTAPTMALIF